MMTEHTAQHTPGPWKADIRTGCFAIYPSNEDHNCLCGSSKWAIVYQDGRGEDSAPGGYPLLTEEQHANAEFICRACNSHDGLVNAIKFLLAVFDNPPPQRPGGQFQAIFQLRQELKKAEAK